MPGEAGAGLKAEGANDTRCKKCRLPVGPLTARRARRVCVRVRESG